MELILQTKDRQIIELEKKLASKDRRIKEVENIADMLKSKIEELEAELREEMRISDHYNKMRTALYDETRNVNQMRQEMNEKVEQLKDSEEKVEELELKVEELQEELECVKEDLKTKEEELNIALGKDIRMKEQLGLDKDASEREVLEHLRKSFHTRSELKRAQDELGEITRTKMTLESSIKSLEHKKDSLGIEIQQNERKIQRMRRGNLDSALSKNKHLPFSVTRRQAELLERTKTLARINVKSFSKLPAPIVAKPSVSHTRSNQHITPVPPATARETHPQKLLRRRTFASIADRETKYCVICRKNYYLRSDCRVHVEPIIYGKYSCCGTDAYNVQYDGCKTVNHLYIYFTGIGNEYTIYDDKGRYLDFKDQ